MFGSHRKREGVGQVDEGVRKTASVVQAGRGAAPSLRHGRALAVLAVMAALATLAVTMSFRSSTQVLTPAGIRAGRAHDAPVQVTGVVVAGSLRRVGGTTELAIAGAGGRSIRVRIAGAAPDTLGPGRRVTVTGRYGRAALVARADAVRIGCDGGQHC